MRGPPHWGAIAAPTCAHGCQASSGLAALLRGWGRLSIEWLFRVKGDDPAKPCQLLSPLLIIQQIQQDANGFHSGWFTCLWVPCTLSSVRDPEVYWVPFKEHHSLLGLLSLVKGTLKTAWSMLDPVPVLPPIDGFQHKQRLALVFRLGTHFVLLLYPKPVTVLGTFVYFIKMPKHLFPSFSHCPCIWGIFNFFKFMLSSSSFKFLCIRLRACIYIFSLGSSLTLIHLQIV